MEHSSSARDLIERAFAQARQSGKPEWWVMAIPVLKNRLLQITGQAFKESDFGASTFREFLQNNTDVLEIDNSFLPGAVTLKSAQSVPSVSGTSTPQRNRVREDLWRAILDYSSGNRFVWDVESSAAIIAPEGSQGSFLPTISPETMTEWKTEFLASPPEKPDDGRLKVWQTQNLPTDALPPALRLQWNRFLKRKVQSTLKGWFESQGIPLPPFVHPAIPLANRDDTELFREFVIKCIAQMSKEELEKLSIPSNVAFRVNSCR
jgi:hypothetical protein